MKEDLLELENVRNLKLLEILVDLLAERVGSTAARSRTRSPTTDRQLLDRGPDDREARR